MIGNLKGIKQALRDAEPPRERHIEVPLHRRGSAVPAGAARRTVKQRKVRPPKPIDFLALFFPDKPEVLVDVATSGIDLPLDASILPDGSTPPKQPVSHALIKPARPGLRGAEAILANLAKRGIRCYPSGDGAFWVESEGGRLDEATRRAITAAGSLIRAYLHGSPLRCALPNHVGSEPPEATTLTLGGAAWCGQCG